jgi:ribosomal protein S18 acetylase RimI-like enzyme
MHALDNVIWQALTSRQAHLAEGSHLARRFSPEISPLAAFSTPSQEGYDTLAQLAHSGDVVGLFLTEPYSPRPGWSFLRGAPLWEMIYENGVHPDTDPAQSPQFVPLGSADLPEMLALVKLTEPGPFNSRTHEMGTYLGIRQGGNLVAMAGERLRLPGYTEVSAVCTHPNHTGRGYARALMMELMKRIQERGETPILHVRHDNVRAIEIYRRLGFRERVLLHYAVLRKE